MNNYQQSKIQKINLQLFAEEGGDDGQQSEKTFTQEEVNRIVQERLARQKPEKPADYDELAEIAKELEDFGYSGTPAEKKAAIKAYKDELKKQVELDELEAQAKETGKDPELMKEIKTLKDEIRELKGERQAQKQAEQQRATADAAWFKQLQEFEEAYPDVDLDKLNSNERFLKFIKGKLLPLKEVYEDFVELIGDTAAETMAKAKSKEARSTSSGKSAKTSDGHTYGLTEAQKREVDEWNKRYPKMPMSYREYASK